MGHRLRIAINGAGVAGPTLAYWLHRAGHEPILVEKAPQRRSGGYVVDFWGLGYTVAERMGILQELRDAGYAARDVRLVNEEGRCVGGLSAGFICGLAQGRYTSLPRADLARAIHGAIDGRVEWVFGDRMISIEERERGVRVGFARGPAREVDLVIGADGMHSAVRNLVFGPERRFAKELGYRAAAFEAEGYEPRDEDAYISYTAPSRRVARFALRGGRTMFLFVFSDALITGPEPLTADERKAVVRRVYSDAGWECRGILRTMDRVDDVYLDHVSQIRMERWSKGRVMLIGDAASAVSLLSGEGAGLAMAQAYALAGEIQRADGDHREAFRRTEQRLRPLVESKQKSTESFAAAYAPKTALGIWMRNRATRLLANPLAAKLAIGRDLHNAFDLPRYEM